MSNISEKTLKKIEEKNITPKPRWHFLLKNYFIWLLFFFSIIIGALAVSVMVFIEIEYDWDIYKFLGRSLFSHIFFSLPYLWAAVLLLFIFVAYYNFRNTTKGYRYNVFFLLGGSIFLSLILGLVFFECGLGAGIHKLFSEQIPFYNSCVCDKSDVWNNPEKGLLGGEIIDIKSQNDFSLQDLNGDMWHIKTECDKVSDCCFLQKGERVELIGQELKDNIFIAKFIRPWEHMRK